MRKLIILVSVLLLIIALGGPALTGHHAEKIIREGQPYVVQGLPDWLALVEHRYERGWFRSTASHRLLVTDPQRAGMLRGWLSDGDFGDQPAIIMDSTVAHGPLVSLFQPGLARVHSRFVVDGGSATKSVPASLITHVALDGQTDYTVRFSDGQSTLSTSTWQWAGAQIAFAPNASDDGLRIGIDVDDVTVQNDSRQTHITDLDATLTLAPGSEDLRLALEYAASLAEHTSSDAPVNGSMTLNGMTMQSINALQAVIRAINAPGQTSEAQIHELVRRTFWQPVTLEWQHTISADEGALSVSLNVQTPAASALEYSLDLQQFTQLFSAETDGQFNATAAAAYVEAVSATSTEIANQVQMLKGMGALTRVDERTYSTSLLKKDDAVFLNGMPIPIQ